jgi:hypothetical protein
MSPGTSWTTTGRLRYASLTSSSKSSRVPGRRLRERLFQAAQETFAARRSSSAASGFKSDHRFYNAKGEGWGADGAFHIAMSTLERQVMNDKEIFHDKRYTNGSIVEKLDII